MALSNEKNDRDCPDTQTGASMGVRYDGKSCPKLGRAIRISVRFWLVMVYETSGRSFKVPDPPEKATAATLSAPPEPRPAPLRPTRRAPLRADPRAHTHLCPPSRRSHDGTRLNVPLVLRLARRACPHSTLFGRTPCAVTQRGSTPRHRTIDRHPQSASSIEKSMSHTTTYFMRICLVS